MAKAVWNGFLRLSLISCPVHLAPAIREREAIRLEPVNEKTGNPVTEQFVDTKTGNVVPADAVVKGHQIEGDAWVTLSRNELDKLAGEASNMVELAHFVPRDRIDRTLLDTPYFIYPEGQLAGDAVHALRLAMVRSARAGVGRIHLDGRSRFALIEPHGAGLMLSTMRNPPEMERSEFEERPESDIPAEMIEIVEAIINRRAAEFDAATLRDRFEDELRALIEDKAKHGSRPSAGAGPGSSPPAAAQSRSPSNAATAPSPAASSASAGAASLQPSPGMPATPVAAATASAAPGNDAPDGSAQSAAPPLPQAAPPSHSTSPPSSDETPMPAAAPPPPGPAPAAAAETSAEEAAGSAQPATAAPAFPEDPAAPAATPESPPTQSASADELEEIGAEILLHIMGLGDRRYVESGWAGQPGSRRQIEAISIRPRDGMAPSTVEFRVFAQEGRATAWVSNGNYAGTRGRGLPLTGFAVRPSPELRDRVDIVYEGCFFEGGVVGPKRNGEVCASPIGDDPLEAIRVQIYERAPD